MYDDLNESRFLCESRQTIPNFSDGFPHRYGPEGRKRQCLPDLNHLGPVAIQRLSLITGVKPVLLSWIKQD